MQALSMRFEAPESKNRWDSTLFSISDGEGFNLPLEEIANVLLLQKAPPPNKSTLNVNRPLAFNFALNSLLTKKRKKKRYLVYRSYRNLSPTQTFCMTLIKSLKIF